jgi:hypothetical protein
MFNRRLLSLANLGTVIAIFISLITVFFYSLLITFMIPHYISCDCANGRYFFTGSIFFCRLDVRKPEVYKSNKVELSDHLRNISIGWRAISKWFLQDEGAR